MPQYSHRSACVLRTEAPGRHSTQTRTQASPAVAESEARLAIGFLVVDNSGLAAADSEFAASVMRQLRRPIRVCSRQMSRWITTMKSRRTPPVRTQARNPLQGGEFWDQHYNSCSRSEYSAPKNDKNYVAYHMVPHACFLAARTGKKQKKEEGC